MNREDKLKEMLGTIHHYAMENPEANIYNIGIQIATQLCMKEDKDDEVTPALLLALKYMSERED